MLEASVIVINKNRVDDLRRCVNSIVKYTQDVNYELIVFDIASNDESVSYLQTYDFNFEFILRSNQNISYPESLNRAIGFSRGKYIYILNNDCEVHSNWLRNAIDFMNSHLNVGHALSLVLWPDGSIQSHGANLDAKGNSIIEYSRRAFNDIPKVPRYFAYGGFGLHKRSVLTMIGGIPEYEGVNLYWAEDNAYCMEMWKSGYTVMLCPDSVITHHHSKTERSGHGDNIEKGRSLYMRDWGEFLKVNDGFDPERKENFIPWKQKFLEDFKYQPLVKKDVVIK